MTDKTVLKPIQSRSGQAASIAQRPNAGPVVESAPASEAVVSNVKPVLSGEMAVSEAQRIAASLSSTGSKGLDAIKPLDKAAIDKLLSDD